MFEYTYIELPLYSDYFYSYEVTLEENAYSLEIVYNSYAERWFMSLYTEDLEPIALSMTLVPQHPIMADYATGLQGFFWLEPIPSIKTEKYKLEPEALSQYYVFKYILNE